MTGFISATPGIYYYTVPTTGTYDVTADGAQGGASDSSYGSGGPGGAGAVISGDIYLQAGAKLEIVVGGEGQSGVVGGGGGGGSFVIEVTGASDTILAVAGGGGGGGYAVGGGDGGISPSGGHGGGKSGGAGGGRFGGGGGAGGGGSFGGGGGGGFTGGNGASPGAPAGAGATLGLTFSGGTPGTSGGGGGIGGGGGAALGAGGGGGGFGGGGGGGFEADGGGGGGGSYLDAAATDRVEMAGVNEGDGLVTVAEIVCFRSGTRILTDRGDVTIENLKVSDLLMTASGAYRPVRWLGSRRVGCARHPEPSVVWPIRIQEGAFAPGVPARALWVSPGHSVFIEGVLIQAEKLVNGATILQVPMNSVEYWHVELDSHDIILAEGLAAESYLDTGNRAGFFADGGAYLEAHPDFKAKHWAETCVPLAFDGATMQTARLHLRDRAVALGYVLTENPELHGVVDGMRVDPVRLSAERVAFLFPEGGSRIELRSRTFTPAHISTENLDTRSLGICVSRLQIDGEVVPLDEDAKWSSGWHGLERYENDRLQRWSRDRMPLPEGTRLVVIDMYPQTPAYWCEPTATAIPPMTLKNRR